MSTRRGVTEQAAIAAIDSGTRVLRLPTIRDRFAEIAAAAEREQLSYNPGGSRGNRTALAPPRSVSDHDQSRVLCCTLQLG
jgi:hypothetical protein